MMKAFTHEWWLLSKNAGLAAEIRIWAVYLCPSRVFQSRSLCLNRASWESGHAQDPWLDQFNLPSTLFFLKFQNKHRKDSRNANILWGADLRGVFEMYTPKKPKKGLDECHIPQCATDCTKPNGTIWRSSHILFPISFSAASGLHP